MAELESGVVFETGSGGTLLMLGDAHQLSEFGVNDGFAFYEDFFIDAAVDMTLDISEGYDVTGSLQHVTGDPVMTFALISTAPNGTADIRFTGLKSEAWYRLQFDGVLAQCDGGRAHGQSSSDGIIQFNSVVIPNE